MSRKDGRLGEPRGLSDDLSRQHIGLSRGVVCAVVVVESVDVLDVKSTRSSKLWSYDWLLVTKIVGAAGQQRRLGKVQERPLG